MNARGCGILNRTAGAIVGLYLLFFYILPLPGAIRMADIPTLSLRVASGFNIIQVASPDVCGEIQSIAFDTRGRLFVATPYEIRILVDENRDGIYDAFTLFARFQSSGKIYFDNVALYGFSERSLFQLPDANGDGVIDTQPQRLFEFNGNDPLFQALKRGPDGWWYMAVGYGASIDNLHIAGFPLIFKKDCGAILRFAPDFTGAQIVAHGFYNPAGFDFDDDGSLFVCDRGDGAYSLVPFKSGSRLLKVKNGGHYGWTQSRGGELVAKPGYYFDAGSQLEDLGVSTPSALVVYRHKQFPEYFRNGIFLSLWSSGKILFFQAKRDPEPVGGSEVFLEPITGSDFAPIDIAVAPDGSLYIATGGAKTTPRIFKIEYALSDKKPQDVIENISPLVKALNAPQPLEPWSRFVWIKEAEKVGFNLFGMAIGSEIYTPEQRARAVEIKMELFDGLTFREARAGARASSPIVRKKIAWALQFSSIEGAAEILSQLALDPVPEVRSTALDAIAAHIGEFRTIPLLPMIFPNLQHPDKQTRLATARLAARLGDYEWKKFIAAATNGTPESQLTAAMSMAMRKKSAAVNPELINLALNIFIKAQENQTKLDALRLIVIGLGDYPPDEPASPVSSVFESAADRKEFVAVSNRVFSALKTHFPNPDPGVSFELARVFSMLQDYDRRLLTFFASAVTRQSPLTSDFFFLSALSTLPPPRSTYEPVKIPDALLTMLGKYENLPRISGAERERYLNSLISRLLINDPALAGGLLKNPLFLRNGLARIAPALDIQDQERALKLFLSSATRGASFKPSSELINWIGGFTNDAVWAFLQYQWTNSYLQDDILIHLSNNPRPADREKFFQGLNSRRQDVVMACVDALLKLPPDTTPPAQLRVLQLLRRIVREPEQKLLRDKTLRLLSRLTNTPFLIEEISSDPENLLKIYDPIFVRFINLYPAFAPLLDGESNAETFRILNLTRTARFPNGNPERGWQIFVKRGCAHCHNEYSEFAPPLVEFSKKMPIQFLTQEIIFPNQRLSKEYKMQILTLKNGQRIAGITRFIGDDYTFIQTAPTNTIRILTANIGSIQKHTQSVMPPGLLNGITIQDLADLCAFIKQEK